MHDHTDFGNTNRGDSMKDSKALLTSILNTTQMGQIGIRSALDRTMKPKLRDALESQLREYDTIESQAHCIAQNRNWRLKEVNPGVRAMANAMTKARLSYGDVNSKLAAMMIQGNTRGIIIGLKDQHRTKRCDAAVQELSQRLLNCEHENIRQMQDFL